MEDLLIYGDSFGEEENVTFPKKHPLHEKAHKLLSFHQLLRESNLFNSVITYAKGGTSLWSQYKIFRETYKGEGRVVWFITHPCRFIVNSPNGELRITSLASVEQQIWEAERLPNTSVEVGLLKSAKDYIVYMQDIEEESFKHQKLLEEIQKTVGDKLVLVDSFNFFKNTKLPLYIVSRLENEMFIGSGKPIDYQKHRRIYHDLRRNHMIEENHRLFCNQLINKIQTGEEIDMSDYFKPNPKDFAKYFTIRQ